MKNVILKSFWILTENKLCSFQLHQQFRDKWAIQYISICATAEKGPWCFIIREVELKELKISVFLKENELNRWRQNILGDK